MRGSGTPGGCQLFMMVIGWRVVPSTEIGKKHCPLRVWGEKQVWGLNRFSWRCKAATLLFLSILVPSSFQPTKWQNPKFSVSVLLCPYTQLSEQHCRVSPMWKMVHPQSMVFGFSWALSEPMSLIP